MKMAMRRPSRNDEYGASSTPKRRKNTHVVSDSDEGDFDSDDERSSVGQFASQSDFMNTFGGYASDEASDEHDDGNSYD